MTKTKPKTAVLYFRVSSDSQRKSGSIARQTTLLPSLVEKQGLEIVGRYTDDGISGKTLEARPGLVKLLGDLPKLRPDFVAFLRPDRIGRPETTETLMQLASIATEHHVGLLFAVEDTFTGELSIERVSPDDPMAVVRWMGRVAQAGAENKRKGRDIRMGNFRSLIEGKWPHGPKPYGWRYDRRAYQFIAVPAEQDEICRMYSLCVEHGMGTPAIATDLRSRKVLLPRATASDGYREKMDAKTPNGSSRWRQGTVRQFLRTKPYLKTGVLRIDLNVQYADLYRVWREGGGESPHVSPDGFVEFKMVDENGQPVIDADVYDTCQAQLARRNARHTGRGKTAAYRVLFAPWARCECGASLRIRGVRRMVNGTHRTYRYLYCAGAVSESKRLGAERCPLPSLKGDRVDDVLWSMITDYLSNPGFWTSNALIEWACQTTGDVDTADLQVQADGLEAQLTKAHKQKTGYLDLYGDEAIDRAELVRRSAAVNVTIEDVTTRLDAVQAQLDSASTATEDTEQARKMLTLYGRGLKGCGDDLKRQLDGLGWHARRTLLHRLLGGTSIVLAERPATLLHSPLTIHHDGHDALRAQLTAAVNVALDGWQEARMLQGPKGDSNLAVFVKSMSLPFQPCEIVDALSTVGVVPGLSSRVCAL